MSVMKTDGVTNFRLAAQMFFMALPQLDEVGLSRFTVTLTYLSFYLEQFHRISGAELHIQDM